MSGPDGHAFISDGSSLRLRLEKSPVSLVGGRRRYILVAADDASLAFVRKNRIIIEAHVGTLDSESRGVTVFEYVQALVRRLTEAFCVSVEVDIEAGWGSDD